MIPTHLNIRLLIDTPLIITNKVISQKDLWEIQTTKKGTLLLATPQPTWRWYLSLLRNTVNKASPELMVAQSGNILIQDPSTDDVNANE